MNVKKNYLYNVVYQLITIILPLITVPYVTRILGSEGIGMNSYSNSLVQYFVLAGTLGTSLYGNRTIAYVRDNKEKRSSVFWNIFSLRIMTTTLALIAFFLFLKWNHRINLVFALQSLYILAASADISWLFMGMEDFKKTVVRNLIVKLLSVVLIFLVVKSRQDLWLYVLILGCSQLLGQLTMWVYLPKVVSRVSVSFKSIKPHIAPSIQLFIPQAAIQVYVVLNKTMLGYFSTYSEVGYFDNADKIIKIVLSVVTALGVVMLPRISNIFAKGNLQEVNKYIYKSFKFVTYLSVPMMFGLAGIAHEFSPIYFGAGFEKTGTIIMIISPIIVLIAWSNVIGQQYLLPTGKSNQYTLSVCCGAVANFILNMILVRHFKSFGVSIGTVVAELTVTTVQLYLVRNQLNIRYLFKGIGPFFVSGFLMFVIVRGIGLYMGARIVGVALQILVGGIVYIGCLLLMKEETNKRIIKEGILMIKSIKK